MHTPLRLHIGGEVAKEGWKILNVQPGPLVDFVGNCLDLSRFADDSVAELYLSHVLEHLDYKGEVQQALGEFGRVLASGGRLMIGVPDLDALCHLMGAPYIAPDVKFQVMRMIYGGHSNPYDYHKAGYNLVFLYSVLTRAGFVKIRRLNSFGLFKDTTEHRVQGVPISLNVEAFKP